MMYPLLEDFRADSSLSEQEKDELWILEGGLSSLDRHRRSFVADFMLFHFARSNDSAEFSIESIGITRGGDWLRVAARDGALNIYHFVKTIEGIERTLAKLPAMRERIEMKNFREARRVLRAAFPDLDLLRHAIAHAGEKSSDSHSFKRHSTSEERQDEFFQIGEKARNIMIEGAIMGDRVTETYEGKVVSYRMSPESLSALADANKIIESTFIGHSKSMASSQTPPSNPT